MATETHLGQQNIELAMTLVLPRRSESILTESRARNVETALLQQRQGNFAVQDRSLLCKSKAPALAPAEHCRAAPAGACVTNHTCVRNPLLGSFPVGFTRRSMCEFSLP
jgi:hypothetical protein